MRLQHLLHFQVQIPPGSVIYLILVWFWMYECEHETFTTPNSQKTKVEFTSIILQPKSSKSIQYDQRTVHFKIRLGLENTKDFHSPHTKYMFSLMFAAAGLHDRICYGIHDMMVILKWMVLWCYWMDLVDFCCKIKLANSTFVFNEFGVVNVSCSHWYIQNRTKIRYWVPKNWSCRYLKLEM